jgi:hypothetical protein
MLTNIHILILKKIIEITEGLHLLKNLQKITINKHMKNKGEIKKLIKNNKQVKIILH